MKAVIARVLPPYSSVPSRNDLPVLLSIPHAGREYPNWLSALAWSGRASLEPLEDPLVDRLAWRALAAGHGAVIARCPRAAIDCNRGEDELDPAAVEDAPPQEPGSRSRAGLGLIPSRTHRHGGLWRRLLSSSEVEARLDQVHRPYHREISSRLDRIAAHHGGGVLIDLHSMPPRPRGAPQAQVVIGDRHGTSAADWISRLAIETAREAGFTALRNDPYAGGHIVNRHGNPAANVHAVQVEIDRTAYCLRDCRTPGPGFERVARLVEALADRLGHAMSPAAAIAAE